MGFLKHMHIDILALSFLLSLIHFTSTTLISTGQTVVIEDIPYYRPPTPYATVSLTPTLNSATFSAGYLPVTVVGASATNASSSTLGSLIGGFAFDDVWNEGFLQAVLVQYVGGSGPVYPANASLTIPGANQSSQVSMLRTNDTSTTIPSGPYLASADGSLYQVYRLYSDFAGAFTQPLIASTDGAYVALPANIAGVLPTAIGVPSRLYYTKTTEKPLAGIRLGVKDIFDVAGVKTSDGNRAWYGFYPAATVNSVPVQRLVDAGAIIVGKMKTSQFANGELATADWVDYHSPFNPRGDGYQDPSSSSSGPGAGEGSYPWLDLGLGSDTGGSIRGPSQVQGLFGNRPSHGLVDLTGVMPLAPQLDTAGFLTRDPTIWTAAAKVLYADLPFYTSYPSKLNTIGFPTTTTSTSSADSVLLSFLSKLESFLSTTASPLNLSTLWSSNTPAGATSDLDDFLNITYPILIAKEQTRLVRDPFYAAYGAAHDGRRPFVDPAPLVRWAFGDAYPDSTLTQAVANKTTFQDWWASVVQPNSTTTCSDSLILYTAGADPTYRNQYNGPPEVPYGFGTSRISPFAEVPDFVIPIGEASYNSTITDHVESLPVTVDILAAKGCDRLIFGLVDDLLEAGIVNVSLTGQTIFGGEILLRM